MLNLIKPSIARAAALTLGLGATTTLADASFAQEAETRAASEYELSTAVAIASRQWRDAFNAGDAAGAAAMYEEDAIMVAEPFGTFEGREAIEAFWTQLIEDGFDDIVYANTTTVVSHDLTTAEVSASWRMNNAHGVITRELWALQSDGIALLREDHFEVAQ
ncbi:nuclear transport factor 2 family protein [Cognatiyoonia sp. IB215182]|uniref:nuclear transport factor 2 family protein n=1 Tax=Cognatiyoonia sp. IB215182 TaxID=3097353 RepID=UPI002A0C9205|nr:nuclear transport factor 2 family protein [Cognatiyoonia sp. IB215182]MDX8355337.1 nuclear transport factor 2 family protein [Cognatiyoonia sp. IB215182]